MTSNRPLPTAIIHSRLLSPAGGMCLLPVLLLLLFSCASRSAHYPADTSMILGNTTGRFRIAILDLKPSGGMTAAQAETITGLLTSTMVNTGKFTVVERSSIKQILKEQSLQQVGLTDTDSAVRVGRLLAANKIAVGTVSRLGSRYIISVRVIDVEKAEVQFASSTGSGSLEGLEKGVHNVGVEIASRIDDGTVRRIAPAKRPVHSPKRIVNTIPGKRTHFVQGIWYKGLVPGWVQIERGDQAVGGLFIGSMVLLTGRYFAARNAYAGALTERRDLATPYLLAVQATSTAAFTSVQIADTRRQAVRKAAQFGNAWAAGLFAVWAWNYLDALLFSGRGRGLAEDTRKMEWRADFALMPMPTPTPTPTPTMPSSRESEPGGTLRLGVTARF